jgi:hypothetical protein
VVHDRICLHNRQDANAILWAYVAHRRIAFSPRPVGTDRPRISPRQLVRVSFRAAAYAAENVGFSIR